MRLRAIRRGGEPFLYLPARPILAARALTLYPAQTIKARGAKQLLGLALRLRLAVLPERIELKVNPEAPFARFLAQSADTSTLPNLAMLAGNPRALGRRYVFLVFNSRGDPTAVIKVGVNEAAQQLIECEADFLGAVPPMTPGIPRLRGKLHMRGVRALALNFFPGKSPRPTDIKPLATLLGAWLSPNRQMPLRQFGQWRQLMATDVAATLKALPASLNELSLRTALSHGDLAPWNVKSTGGRWTVIDWERGELHGLPTWDWLHFVFQPALLVQRASPGALLSLLERTLASVEFETYAQRAGVNGQERLLTLGYLAYCTRVIGQTEGGEKIRAVERLAQTRWFPDRP